MNGTMDVSIDLLSVSKFSTQCSYLYWETSLNSETLIKKRFLQITTLCDGSEKCFKGSYYTRSHSFIVGNPYEMSTTGMSSLSLPSLSHFFSF